MRLRVVDGDIIEIRDGPDRWYLDAHEENKLYEFLLSRQLDRTTAMKAVHLSTKSRP